MPLDAFLEQALRRSEDARALELDIRSLDAEIKARDLDLSPLLSIELNRYWDRRQSFSSNPETSGRTADVRLEQPFPTGTRLNLASGAEAARFRTSPAGDRELLYWEAGIAQSLWQNAFGRQTRLRRSRDAQELKSRMLGILAERQRITIDFESLYWDILYARQELAIRRGNLDRSRRILSWGQDRFGRAAAVRIDLLQAEALVSSRELQLQIASDTLKTVTARLAERVALEAPLEPADDDLRQERALTSFVVRAEDAPDAPVLIAALREQVDTEYALAQAKLEKDRLLPEFEVGYAYGRQGADGTLSGARRGAFDGGNSYHEVGLVLSVPLDVSLISTARRAFEARADASALRAERARRQSGVRWADLERAVADQKARVDTALRVAKLQKDKSDEERLRFQRGRTTAFQAITFEQEAAESELLVLRLLTDLRRAESQARAYIQRPEGAP